MSITAATRQRPVSFQQTSSTSSSTPLAQKKAAETAARQGAAKLFKDEFVGASAGMSAKIVAPKPLTQAQTNALKKELSKVYDKEFQSTMTGSFAYTKAVEHLQQKLIDRGESIPKDGLLGGDTYAAMKRQYGKAAADQISKHLMSFGRGGEEGG
ncbi:MAG: hypothetical protein QM817_40955 [Archangium sp.]